MSFLTLYSTFPLAILSDCLYIFRNHVLEDGLYRKLSAIFLLSRHRYHNILIENHFIHFLCACCYMNQFVDSSKILSDVTHV